MVDKIWKKLRSSSKKREVAAVFFENLISFQQVFQSAFSSAPDQKVNPQLLKNHDGPNVFTEDSSGGWSQRNFKKSWTDHCLLLKNHDGPNVFWNHCTGVDFKEIPKSHGFCQAFWLSRVKMFQLLWILDFKALCLNQVQHYQCDGKMTITRSTFYSTIKETLLDQSQSLNIQLDFLASERNPLCP